MANVLFKRGSAAHLPSGNSIIDGAFYLTTDTNRLYVGYEYTEDNQTKKALRLLNQTVQYKTWSELTALNSQWIAEGTQEYHVNDFYYITGGPTDNIKNILAIYLDEGTNGNHDYKWEQINKDTNTVIQGTEFDVSASNNVGTVTYTITDSGIDEGSRSITASFGVQGAGGITVTSDTNNGALVLTGDTYTLSRGTAAGNIVPINLASSSTSSTVSIKAGTNVSVTAVGSDQIEISAVDRYIDAGEFTVSEGQLLLELTRMGDPTGNETISVTASNVGILLNDGKYAPITSTLGATAGSGIYSKDQIDSLLSGLNGMSYIGTIAGSSIIQDSIHALPTNNVHVGDVYLVADDNLTASKNETTGVVTVGTAIISDLGDTALSGIRTGDMFIAKGTETNGVITSDLTWSYVPAGNDSSDQFNYHSESSTSNNSITLRNNITGSADIMSIQLTQGNGISLSSTSTGSNNLQTTISHAAVTSTTSSSTASSTLSFAAISSLSIDSFGHVTNINTETFTPAVYGFSDARHATNLINSDVVNGTRMATATNAGPNDVSFAVNLTQDNTTIVSTVTKLSSETIKLSKGSSDNEVVMNLEWGTF